MSPQTLATFGILALGVVLIGVIVWALVTQRREAVREAFVRRLGPTPDLDVDIFRKERRDPLVDALGPVGDVLEYVRVRSGGAWGPPEFLGSIVFFGVGGILLASAFLPMPSALGGFILVGIPVFLAYRAGESREAELARQLPEAIELIASALRSGNSMAEAVRIAGEEMPEPVGGLLRPVAEEYQLGVSMRDALRGLLDRAPGMFEVRLLVGTVQLQQDTGGNLIDILDTLADTIRERVMFKEKAQALTSEVRSSAMVLLGIPILAAFGLATFVPAYLEPLFETELGRTMLTWSGAAAMLGVAIMTNVASVDP